MLVIGDLHKSSFTGGGKKNNLSVFKGREREKLKIGRIEDYFTEFCYKEKSRNEAVARGKMVSRYERNNHTSIS